MSRRETVGGSEIAAVLNASPYQTPEELWRAKVEGTPFEDNEHTIRGKVFESAILDWWEVLDGRALRRGEPSGRFSKDLRQVSLVHPCGWAAATLDGITEDGKLLVEAKCPVGGKQWDDRNGAHPFHYRVQVLWQIGVAQGCGLPVESGELIAGPLWGRLMRFPIEPDPEFFRLALERAREFVECVKRGEPLPASFGGNMEAGK